MSTTVPGLRKPQVSQKLFLVNDIESVFQLSFIGKNVTFSIQAHLTARTHASSCPFKRASRLPIGKAEMSGGLLPLIISIVYGLAGSQLAEEYHKPSLFSNKEN